VALKLIIGTDEYLVTHHAKKAVGALCPAADQALNLETIDGSARTIGEAVTALKTTLGALRTMGLFGGQKTVWLRDAGLFKDKVISKNEAVKNLIEELTDDIKKGLPSAHHLVLSAPGMDKRSVLYKACAVAGEVEDYELPEQVYKQKPLFRERAQKLFTKAGCRASGAALDLFVEKIGADTRQLVQEAEKLTLYLGERKNIDVEDVRAITSSSAEAITWDFTDALGERRLDEALRILRQLLFQGDSHMAVIFAIENLFQNLTQYRAYLDQGWLRLSGGRRAGAVQWGSDPGMENMFSLLPSDPRKMHWFRTAKLAQQAKHFTPDELRRFQRWIVDTHEQLVSSGVPSGLILEKLVIGLIGDGKSANR